MEPVCGPDDYQRCVGAVRRAASGYASNLYATGEQVEGWTAAGALRSLSVDGAVLLLRADGDFHRVYHVAEDQSALRAALRELPEGTYVADLIGQGSALDEVSATYAGSGFAAHAFLRRMIRVQPPSEPMDVLAENEVAVAAPRESVEVAAFVGRLLDPLAEQVPNAAELKRAALAGQLLVVRRAAEIAGMLMYDLKGRTAHLRYWHVDAGARGEGVGRRLMAAFLSRCAQAQRLVLWVIGDNARSIAIYRHYGFAADGLLDRIMTLRKEQHQ